MLEWVGDGGVGSVFANWILSGRGEGLLTITLSLLLLENV
jgi:hypothetical protein